MSAFGIYIHVPWCRRRCPYCAFYVEVDREVAWDAYVDAVLREHAMRTPMFGPLASTVFLGGGTPSRMPAEPLARLLANLPREPGAEVSAEANPEDVDARWVAHALEAGIQRVSLGVQTFDPQFAPLLNRACSVDRAAEVVHTVATAGFRSWSIDVMFGLPGQTVEALAADVERLLATDPPHVALYGLTIEPGTPFERARDLGRFDAVDADTWRTMYDFLVERLERHGLRRYEVSNFAKPGHESVHNRLYWSNQPYMGLGPSAHGFAPDGTRYVNRKDAAAYLHVGDPTGEQERPLGKDAATDFLVAGLRGITGISLAELAARTGFLPRENVRRGLVRAGMLSNDPERLVFTPEAFPVGDGITTRLVDALEPAVGSLRAAEPAPGH